jgi:uncharacterized protein YutE (UPF0331/DUF86 family)
MTFLVERLAELRRYLDHLRMLRGKVSDPVLLRDDLTLHNDVLYSLLTVCQLIIDIAGELSARNGMSFGDYTQAVRNLASIHPFSAELVEQLARLPGFRNVLIHDYVGLDMKRVMQALNELASIEEFVRVVAAIEEEGN